VGESVGDFFASFFVGILERVDVDFFTWRFIRLENISFKNLQFEAWKKAMKLPKNKM
jgi:hypothetical protein